MTLTEMREVLAKRDIQLTKSLGQNFLHDGNQLRRIVNAAELKATDKVLEIGPGLGPLTELLLAEAGEVLAIELDGRLVEVLRERFGDASEDGRDGALRHPRPRESGRNECGEARAPRRSIPSPDATLGDGDGAARHPCPRESQGRLTLLHDDALGYLRRTGRDWQDWKLVANLPYSVASPILVELALSPGRPERMVTTLQLEVAQRLMAGADDEDYGILTLLVQLDYEPREWFKIPAGCFFPSPEVDSACVVLARRPEPFLNEDQRRTFVRIVKRAFSQRRKMMMKLLKQEWPAETLAAAFAELNISPLERAEKLGLEQFTGLTKRLHP